MTNRETEVFVNPDGSLYHLGVKEGEICPRILTVGDMGRAKMIAEAFLSDAKHYMKTRLFLTITGKFKGIPVSIIAIGMGAPNMAFMVQEASYLFKGKSMAIIRLGTCGIFNPNYQPGTLFLSDKQYYTYRNYIQSDGNAMGKDESEVNNRLYCVAGPVHGDDDLTGQLEFYLKQWELSFCKGAGMSSETFYSCQGRVMPDFPNDSKEVIDTFSKLKVDSCEMETHQLFHLCHERATKSDTKPITRAASVCLGIVSRVNFTEEFSFHSLSDDKRDEVLLRAAQAALDALISVKL